MVKIPELPGSYRPGDVVNGHVLTERGHWVELGNARADGLRRRFLSTQVSTIGDPDKPSRELTGAERQAAERAAMRSSAAPPPPPAAPQHAPHTQQPGGAPPPPARTHAGAPSSAGPGGATQPPPPGGPRNPYGAPPPGAPQQAPAQNTTTKFSCGGCLGVIAVIAAVIGAIAAGANAIIENVGSAPEPPSIASTEPWEPIDLDEIDIDLEDAAPAPSFRLDDTELALVEVAEWETWHADYSSHYVVWLHAPGLDRPRVNLSYTITATDVDGETHEASDYTVLRWGEPALAVGFYDEPFDAEVVDLEVTIDSTFAPGGDPTYEAWVEDFTLEGGSLRPRLNVTLAGDGDAAPNGIGRLTIVVRDDDGDIVNLGVTYPPLPAPGELTTVETYLWGGHPVTEDDDIELTVGAG